MHTGLLVNHTRPTSSALWQRYGVKVLIIANKTKQYMCIKLVIYLFVYFFILKPIDLFTDMVAILNKLVLRSIIGCPGGMSQSV